MKRQQYSPVFNCRGELNSIFGQNSPPSENDPPLNDLDKFHQPTFAIRPTPTIIYGRVGPYEFCRFSLIFMFAHEDFL